jgi:exodeoxyribonuclease-3
MKLRIATWNINSVRLRLDLVLKLLAEHKPDYLCLQEIKAENAVFPAEPLAAAGYRHQAVRGMKGYNGVAVLERKPFEAEDDVDWCRRGDSRHVAVKLAVGVELHNFYVPSGGDVPDPKANDKFAHKLAFVDELAAWFPKHRKKTDRMIAVGDFNIAPLENDVWSHTQLLDVVSHTPVEVEKLGRFRASVDWVDAVRHFVPETDKLYSWWSYRARDWRASDRGRRLDHVWVTPPLKKNLKRAEVLKDARDWPKASDHVPVTVDID